MMWSRSAGLLARVSQLIRSAGAEPRGGTPPKPPDADLRPRVDRLEQMVEALQDQVYRHEQREEERFANLERSVQPDELARALSADARRRGI